MTHTGLQTAMAHCGLIAILRGITPAEAVPVGHAPVSYTHLDVYKRQLQVIEQRPGGGLQFVLRFLLLGQGLPAGRRGPSTRIQRNADLDTDGTGVVVLADLVLAIGVGQLLAGIQPRGRQVSSPCLLYTSRCV